MATILVLRVGHERGSRSFSETCTRSASCQSKGYSRLIPAYKIIIDRSYLVVTQRTALYLVSNVRSLIAYLAWMIDHAQLGLSGT